MSAQATGLGAGARDLPRLGGLPVLRELRGERIPRADEVAGRHRA